MIKVIANLVPGEGRRPGLQTSVTFCVLAWPFFSGYACVQGERQRGKQTDRETDTKKSGISSYKDTNPIKPGPHYMTTFNINYFLRGSITENNYTGG